MWRCRTKKRRSTKHCGNGAVEQLEAVRLDGPEVGEGARRVQVLAHLTRLRLACCIPRLVLDSGGAPPSSKLATFAATLDELLQNRHKVLVFSQFVKHLKLVEEHLQSAGRRLSIPRRRNARKGAHQAHQRVSGRPRRCVSDFPQGWRRRA